MWNNPNWTAELQMMECKSIACRRQASVFLTSNIFLPVFKSKGLCIKVGRGQGDRDVGTRVWGLGTWGRETRDLGTSSMGRGDVKNRDAGDAGCE